MRFFFSGIAFLCLSGMGIYAQTLPYKDPTLPVEERVRDLLSRMTIEEKLSQMRHIHTENVYDNQNINMEKVKAFCGDQSFGFIESNTIHSKNYKTNIDKIQKYMLEETRLGIPIFIVAESLHGTVQDETTIFPQNIALGSTFNPELAYKKTRAISEELNTMGVSQVLAPCIDVVRDLRWGRVEESFGEDPLLCSVMGLSEVNGYLDGGISPMLKHYGAHGEPTGGLNLSSVSCNIHDLIDVYLKPFETIITQTNIMAVMSSYNSWNRVPNSASKFLMTEILRNRWGFKGYVYSDWGSISMLNFFHHVAESNEQAAMMALSAGLDAEASSNCYPLLIDAVKEGRYSIENIDLAVSRILRAKFAMGLFENPYGKTDKAGAIRSEEKVQLAKDIAYESAVLLKNEGNLLPFDIKKLKSIAVIGPNANQVQFGDYSWSKDNKDGVTPLQGIQSWAGKKVKVNYAMGCSITSLDTSKIAEAVEAARQSDVVVLCCGSSSTRFARPTDIPSNCGEGVDLHDIALTGAQEQLIREVTAVGKPTVLVLVAGKPFAIAWEKENIPAILAQWYAGEQEGNALADILFGKINPSGKLNFSFPKSTGHLPVYYNHLPTDKGFYKRPGSYEDGTGRDYAFSSPAPLWAFGHGLSYTTFAYSNLKTDKERYNETDTIQVSVQLTNTGKRSGKEVVQVYVRDLVSSIVTPMRQLKAFAKPELKAGESRTLTLSIPVSELALSNELGHKLFESGEYKIEVGAASDDIKLNTTIILGNYIPRRLQANAKRERPVGRLGTITGLVCDVQATALAQVEIYSAYSNKKLGVTDKAGKYSITAQVDDNLIFKCKGYDDTEVEIREANVINVKMNNTAN